MKVLLKAILRAVRRAMRAAARAARGVGGFVGGMIDGLFAGPYVEEFEEAGLDELVEDTDNAARAEADRLARTPVIREWTPGTLVKRAVELRSTGQDWSGVFDVTDPEQRRLSAFVAALDECGLRAITHMPIGTLERHLQETGFRAAGLHPVGKTIVMAREAEAAKVEVQPDRPRRRSGSSAALVRARSEGREVTLSDVLEANRRAAGVRG